MFNKPSLKNRFKMVESKLESSNHDFKLAEVMPDKALHPEIHAIARSSNEDELELSHYLRSMKKAFKRVEIPAVSADLLALEESISEAVNVLSSRPCAIQMSYPKEARGVECFKYFVASLEEQPHLWKLVFKDQDWISLAYGVNTTILSFSAQKSDGQKIEGLLKSISTKAGSLVSFNIQKKNNLFYIQLRLEAFDHKKVSTEREAGL